MLWGAMALVSVTGCSRKPSIGDLERELALQLGGCENLHVTDVEKIDGYAEGDNRYVAEVTYAVEFRKLKNDAKPAEDATEAMHRLSCLSAELPLKIVAPFTGDEHRAKMHQDVTLRRSDKGWRIIETADHR